MTARHAHPIPAPDEVVDPVCGMTITPADAVGHVQHKGQTYYFCSHSCLERFRANPAEFLEPRPPSKSSAPPPSGREVDYICPMVYPSTFAAELREFTHA